MVLAAIVLFLVIRRYGESLTAPAPSIATTHTSVPETAAAPNALLHVLLTLAVVAIVGRLLARVFVSIRQPPVIGEVLAGIALGPSLLGRLAPDVYSFILPSSIAPFLNVIAQLGVILYMFLVGLELNAARVRIRAHATVAISHASILAPFILGSCLALYLYPRLSTSAVPFTSFALFMGVAMSITAFPVLARILSDRGLTGSELGIVALTCAAVDDVTAWCLLAFVVGVAQAKLQGAAAVALLTVGFIGTMVLLVRPIVVRFASRSHDREPTPEQIGAALAAMLLAALTTEMIGVHAIFGAFLFGAVVPHDSGLARVLIERSKDVVTIVLLPAFFAFAGMRTRIDLVSGTSAWTICALIVVVATAGKFGGTFIAARVAGLGSRQAASLGILMNTRGLMELIVLNTGLDLGVISPMLFTMMVLMALATTMATTPIVDLLVPGLVRYNRPA